MHHSGHEFQIANFNLEALPLKELRQLQKDLAEAISTYEDRYKAEASVKLDGIDKEMDYSIVELIGVEVKTTSAPVVAKYGHPENAAPPGRAAYGNRYCSLTRWLVAKLQRIWL